MENPTLRRSTRITWRRPIDYTGFFSIEDDDDYSSLYYSDEDDGEPEDEEDEDSVIIGVTITNEPPVLTCVTPDDICSFCLEAVTRGKTYYLSECKHLYCGECIGIAQLNQCTRCTLPLTKASPVNIIYVKVED